MVCGKAAVVLRQRCRDRFTSWIVVDGARHAH